MDEKNECLHPSKMHPNAGVASLAKRDERARVCLVLGALGGEAAGIETLWIGIERPKLMDKGGRNRHVRI
jgi:hypothetical protein